MVILYIYSTCWHMKSMFYECQQVSGGVFELFLSLLCHFGLVCCSSCLLLVLRLFLLLDDLLKLFLVFGLLVVLHGVLDLRFKLCAFYCQ
jgi:hypothetical protein